MFNNEEMVSSSSSSYLPLWAWYYLYITGIIFLCTLCILCYLQKWLCFKIIIRKQWCNKNAIGNFCHQVTLFGYRETINLWMNQSGFGFWREIRSSICLNTISAL
ncbi:unnamed protein product [Schistosoma rodhaini]|uniref:Uncharacterized protein n=1 Tax=Schistosoma rodhaini TaxID=6188 RepID=A0AA85GFV6_9TREM|nr:unnamed protein product [Schistosoma rodhaini]